MDKELTFSEREKYLKWFDRIGIIFDWVNYKDKTVFVGCNLEASKKAGKPMFDVFYCATKAMNHCVLKTVQYDKNKFKPSELSKVSITK